MTDMDRLRAEVLSRVDRTERAYKLGFFGAAAVETAFLVSLFFFADFHDRVQLLIIVSSVAVYTIVVLAVFALGAHVSRQAQRILQALTLLDPGR